MPESQRHVVRNLFGRHRSLFAVSSICVRSGADRRAETPLITLRAFATCPAVLTDFSGFRCCRSGP
jgi:hypothetical protein